MHPLAQAALGIALTAFTNETFVKPAKVARLAQSFSHRVRKPMLSFVPPPGATLKSIITTPLAVGDLNLHPAGRQAPGPGRVSFGSPYQIPVPTRSFACVFSCDTLEHLDRPDLALLEWHRVADRVFIVAPPWWTPNTWLNKWYIDPALKKAWPIWAAQNRIIWLPAPMSSAYDAGTCRTPQRPWATGPARTSTARKPMATPQEVPAEASTEPSAPGPVSNSSAPALPEALPEMMPTQTSSESQPTEDLLDTGTAELPLMPSDLPYLPLVAEDSPSFTPVSSMMIVSGSDFEND